MPGSSRELLTLQGNIKRDPEGFRDDFELQWRHYRACLDMFSLKPSRSWQEFADLVAFLAQVAASYPADMAAFPQELMDLLDVHAAVLDPALRRTLAKALILLRNRGRVAATEVLPLFFRLFRCQDKALRELLFKHIVADIKTANQHHRDDRLNRSIQNFLYGMLQDNSRQAAKTSLAVLTELWRRHVWRDARTVNVIASATSHPESSIMLAALKFFLGQDTAAQEADGDEDGEEAAKAVQPSTADVYKAKKKGTASSKRKKQAKLKRVVGALKRHARREKANPAEGFAAVQLLHDPQALAERLVAQLRARYAREAWEARLAMLMVAARIIGVHRLLLDEKYYAGYLSLLQPRQRDVTHVLASLVMASHDLVPPEWLQPVLRHLCNQFIHDRARPEEITTGLRTVRELCLRAPLAMAPEMLQDLTAYKKYREKEVSSAAKGLISLFRDVAPHMLEKRDRGRGANMEAAPAAYGAAAVQDRVLGADLLQQAELQELQEAAAEEAAAEEAGSGSDADSSSDAGSLDGNAAAGAAASLAGAAGQGSDAADEADAAALEAGDAAGVGRSQQAGSNGDAAADDDGAAEGMDPEVASDAGAEQLGLDESGSDSEPAAQPSEVDGSQREGSAAEPGSPAGSQHEAALMQREVDDAADSGARADGGLAASDHTSDQQAAAAVEAGWTAPLGSAGTAPADAQPAEEPGKQRRQRPPQLGSMHSLKREVAAAAEAERQRQELAAAAPGAGTPVEWGRILTPEDFERIRELRHRQLVDSTMQKYGLKASKAKRDQREAQAVEEADEALDFRDGLHMASEAHLDPETLQGRHKRRKTKEERLQSVLEGREDRGAFGAAAGRKKNKAGGLTNKEKAKKKNMPAAARVQQLSRRRKASKGGGKKAFKGHGRAGRR